jgi:type IV fimbrial biogenesis protein FimT
MSACTSKFANRGFTIIELMVTLAVAAVLTIVAAPSFSSFMQEQRFRSAMGMLLGDLNFARSEAIKRNAHVLVCPRTSQSAASCNASNDWKSGWTVCYDADRDGQCDDTQAADPNPIRVTSLDPAFELTSTAGAVSFGPLGTSDAALTLTLTASWSTATRTASVAATGAITSRKN